MHRPWIHTREAIPWLPDVPYLVDLGRADDLRRDLLAAGFSLLECAVQSDAANLESALRLEVAQALGLDLPMGDNWWAFADRLGDLLSVLATDPLAVVVSDLDVLVKRDAHQFLRSVGGLLEQTHHVRPSDPRATRQIECFFIGTWPSQSRAI